MKSKLIALAAALSAALATSSLMADDTAGAAATGSAPSDSGGSPGPAPYSGTLGRTFINLDTAVARYSDLAPSAEALGFGLGANLPMTDNFDYTLGYGFDAARAHEFRLTDNVFENGVTTFYRFSHVAPFVGADVGYEWERVSTSLAGVALPARFDRLEYGLNAGVEVPLNDSASLKAGIGDDDSSLRRPHARDWDYRLSANYWLGSVVGTFVGADVKSGRGGALNATELTLGFRFLLGSD